MVDTLSEFPLKDHNDALEKGKKLRLCWNESIRGRKIINWNFSNCSPKKLDREKLYKFSLLMHRTNEDGPEDDRKIFWLIFSDDSYSVIKELNV